MAALLGQIGVCICHFWRDHEFILAVVFCFQPEDIELKRNDAGLQFIDIGTGRYLLQNGKDLALVDSFAFTNFDAGFA